MQGNVMLFMIKLQLLSFIMTDFTIWDVANTQLRGRQMGISSQTQQIMLSALNNVKLYNCNVSQFLRSFLQFLSLILRGQLHQGHLLYSKVHSSHMRWPHFNTCGRLLLLQMMRQPEHFQASQGFALKSGDKPSSSIDLLINYSLAFLGLIVGVILIVFFSPSSIYIRFQSTLIRYLTCQIVAFYELPRLNRSISYDIFFSISAFKFILNSYNVRIIQHSISIYSNKLDSLIILILLGVEMSLELYQSCIRDGLSNEILSNPTIFYKCLICNQAFNSTRLPDLLKCGHLICDICFEKCSADDLCPHCHAKIKIKDMHYTKLLQNNVPKTNANQPITELSPALLNQQLALNNQFVGGIYSQTNELGLLNTAKIVQQSINMTSEETNEPVQEFVVIGIDTATGKSIMTTHKKKLSQIMAGLSLGIDIAQNAR